MALVVSKPPSYEADPETQSSQREDFAQFRLAFDKLAPKKRDVFILVELEGLSSEDAGQVLGIPTATVRTRLFHAKDALRQALSEARKA